MDENENGRISEAVREAVRRELKRHRDKPTFRIVCSDDNVFSIEPIEKNEKTQSDEQEDISSSEIVMIKNEKDQYITLNKQFTFFKYFLPNKRREEVLGDLMETNCQMLNDGLPAYKVRLVMCWQMLLVCLAMVRLRVTDFGRKKKVDK